MEKIDMITPTPSMDDQIKNEGLALYAELTGKEVPGGTPPSDKTSESSDLVFGKYKSIEEAEKAHKALQAEYTKLTQNKTTSEADTTSNTPEPATDASFNKYYEALAKDGKLSDDMYSELETKGFDKDVVDRYLEQFKPLQAQQNPVNTQPTESGNDEATVAAAYSAAGGAEAFSNIQNWAKQNLNEMEIAGFDAIVATGNTDKIKQAVTNLKTRYTESTLSNFDPTKAVGDAPIDSTPSVQAYNSIDEFLADLGESDSYDLHKQALIKGKLKKSPMFKGLKNDTRLTF